MKYKNKYKSLISKKLEMKLKVFILLLIAVLFYECNSSKNLISIDANEDKKQLIYEIGPWDDRNQFIPEEDLNVFYLGKEKNVEPLPLFFRIELMKNYPGLDSAEVTGYPRSAMQIFLTEYGGILQDSMLYQNVNYIDGKYKIDSTSNIKYSKWILNKN